MTAKDFIEKELLPTIESLAESHPYSAFVLMAAGTEFLGKAMRKDAPWDDKSNHGREDFNAAIEKLFPPIYKQYDNDFNLYDKLRCGLLHIMLPKDGIMLHQKGKHLEEEKKLHLSCQAYLDDFKSASQALLESQDYKDKVEQDFYDIVIDTEGKPSTGSTY